jgi:hypothetical protein
MRRCDACEFWVLGGQFLPDNQMKKHKDDRLGYCRRRAPSPYSHDIPHELLRHLTHLSWKACTEEERATDFDDWEEAGLQSGHVWPMTTGSDWCGDWQKRGDDV